MIQHAIFSGKQGSGFISDSFEEISQSCSPVNADAILIIGNTVLVPEMSFDLEGFFIRPLLYLGLYNSEPHRMVFYMGEHNNRQYFQEVFWLSEDRFYLQYKPNGGRDYNRVNGVWCFNKKGKKSKSTIS